MRRLGRALIQTTKHRRLENGIVTSGIHHAKDNLWRTREDKSPINFVVCHSDWEAGFARQIEAMLKVIAYSKNQNLGFKVPYQLGVSRRGGRAQHR